MIEDTYTPTMIKDGLSPEKTKDDSIPKSTTKSVTPVEHSVHSLEVLDGDSEQKPNEASPAPFLPTIRAWMTPLKISSRSTPSALTTLQETGSNLLQEISSPSQWTSIVAGLQVSSHPAKQLTHKTIDKPPVMAKPLVEEFFGADS